MTSTRSPFPIEIRKLELRKPSDDGKGTKSYHLMRVSNADGRSIVVQRWGKTGQFGQIQSAAFASKEGADIELHSKQRSKERGGYEMEFVATKTAGSESELKQLMGPQTFYKIGADLLDHLVPGIDTKGVVDRNHEPKWAKDPKTGRYYDADPRKPRMVEEKKPAEPTLEERIAQDDMWGLF